MVCDSMLRFVSRREMVEAAGVAPTHPCVRDISTSLYGAGHQNLIWANQLSSLSLLLSSIDDIYL